MNDQHWKKNMQIKKSIHETKFDIYVRFDMYNKYFHGRDSKNNHILKHVFVKKVERESMR